MNNNIHTYLHTKTKPSYQRPLFSSQHLCEFPPAFSLLLSVYFSLSRYFFSAQMWWTKANTHRLYPSINKLISCSYMKPFVHIDTYRYRCTHTNTLQHTTTIHQKFEWWNKSKKRKEKKNKLEKYLKIFFVVFRVVCYGIVMHGIWCLWEFHMVDRYIVSAAEFLTQMVIWDEFLLKRPSNAGNQIEQSQRIKWITWINKIRYYVISN